MGNNTNWIQHYGFILVAFAHMTDWKLLDSELEVVQKKMECIISSNIKDYTENDLAQNLIKIIDKYEKLKHESGDKMVAELLNTCKLLKNEPWFDELSASFLLKNLSDVAEADHKIEETEIHFLKNIAEIFGVASPRV
ncbi:uncharacterized protein METZ01_LOCUS169557 [marine metagenome]|uniref:Co-chaperone DjlA N-terminal domain-containing protein n=1 Tax=marine metagenome TaxID=408172 RepID=A0A382BUE2_9ZZZZ